ncbi:MAG: hypothetical protein KBT31_01970, partial [Firmicutes bacterium]|nr:hypothetical protein [Candidatus Colimorpha enterica]
GYVQFTDDELAKEFAVSKNSPTPDHIVYCKANYLEEEGDVAPYTLKKDIEAFTKKNGYAPRVIILKGKGAYIVGADEKQMNTVKVVFGDHCKVQHYSKYFGGYLGMTDDLVNFIVNWEVESYRAKQNK